LELERVRKGRIEKLSSREKRRINRELTKYPKTINRRLIVDNSLTISTRSLQRFLSKEVYSVYVANKKPIISRDSARKRLLYVKKIPKEIENRGLDRIVF
jgi:hypothetical protein